MATIDRIEPAYTPWTPSSSGFAVPDTDEEYEGRHRRPELRRTMSLRVMFRRGKHRRP